MFTYKQNMLQKLHLHDFGIQSNVRGEKTKGVKVMACLFEV